MKRQPSENRMITCQWSALGHQRAASRPIVRFFPTSRRIGEPDMDRREVLLESIPETNHADPMFGEITEDVITGDPLTLVDQRVAAFFHANATPLRNQIMSAISFLVPGVF